ncbi:uncharacterized protein LOC131294706 [Anopheles ziemanni]|uniref:uncharacterized protein LOC131265294 n=1 Tax=Anopheles coustani TaxID=139045 RepID=UPI00265B69E5|nr:uncharacterized protein LOC131265294 [Anopheles coustani]XP_058178733.1 uncharacterized protein LOC131294706 [Anopheles ziemanni]
MDIEEADEGDIIESSQIPNLRENVRKRRIFYGQPPKAEKIACTKRKKINKKRQQNNATVSQCMQREWKSPRGSKRPDQIKPAEGAEEFIKFTTQQDEGQSIGYCPSVSLFEKQKDIVQRYMFSETIEAQQEEMLEQVLEGFRTSYEQATARIVDSSPVPTAMINMSPKVVEDGHRLEPNTLPIDMEICSEPPALFSQLPSKAIVERHVPPESAQLEPIINIIEMEPVMHLTALPKERKVERHKPPVPAEEPTRGHFFCNVGVQHCPVGSFDMTNYNIMMLARLVGINPNSLYTKIRQMIRASDTRMLWQPRNLSQVFTENDPYYANLDYFMSPRL